MHKGLQYIIPDLSLFPITIQRKPELHSAFHISHSAGLSVWVHDRLHDRQPDSAAAVFPRMRLIHLIELRPQIRDILIRDIISCVKYRDESFLPVVFYSDDDLLDRKSVV